MHITENMIKIALSASIEAGNAILKIYKTNFSFENKIDNSPLTIADKESHNIIKNRLLPINLPILSEEGIEISFQKRKDWKQFWLIDPLDGTKEFIKKNDEFTVNIALIEDNYPVGGVIYAPVLNILYFAFKGIGSYKLKNANNIVLTDIKSVLRKSIKLPLKNIRKTINIIASRSHLSKETENFITNLKDSHNNVELVSKGSSLKFCMIAEAFADIYPRFAPTMEWDTAAGQAIVELAGGKVTSFPQNERFIYNKKDLRNPWFIVKLID